MLSRFNQGTRGGDRLSIPTLLIDRKRKYTVHIYCRGGVVHHGYQGYFIKNYQTKSFSPSFGGEVDAAIDNFSRTIETV